MRRIVFSILVISVYAIASAQNDFKEILLKGEKATVHNMYQDIYDDSGNYASVPISIIKGKENGPIFTMISGVHGFEYPPIVAAQELIQELNPELISGTIVIIPLANPNSFYSRTPFLNPQDELNLNRVFPGKENGSITERIAHFMTKVVIAESEVFVDVHGGDANEDLLPFICYYNNGDQPNETERVKALTRASGFDYIVSYPYTLKKDQPAKYAFKQAVQDGKVAMSIECGKLGNVQEDAVDLIKNGIYNILAEMKMYPQQSEVKVNAVNLNKQAYIKSKNRGVFYSDYTAGDQVQKGDVVGLIKDEFGVVITEVTAPQSGVILYKVGTPPINVGETIMCIAYTL